MNALHSKVTPEWYTPVAYVEAALAVMGDIDTDPASCVLANETVRARQFFSKDQSGLDVPWEGRVFLNPPGGLVREFWRKLIREFCYGKVTEAIWIGYSLQQLQTLQSDGPGPVALARSICYPRRRIAFVNEQGVPSRSPTHANYVAYLGANYDTFAIHFTQFGECR